MKKLLSQLMPVLLVAAFPAGAASPAGIQQAVQVVRAVGPEGQGNAAAAKAWQTLSTAPAAQLTTILAGMDDAGPLPANWLRAAVQAVADRELAAGRGLPLVALKQHLGNTKHDARARRLAYDLIARVEPETAKAMIPNLVNDPGVELRREGVQHYLDSASAAKSGGRQEVAMQSFETALRNARDVDQLQAAAKALREFGKTVDVPRQLGFLMDWHVIGPFDNTDRTGFEKVFPPEQQVNLQQELPGKAGKVGWTKHTTDDEYGMVDFNPVLGTEKEVTGYAYAEYEAPAARRAELRLGCKNAWKVWVNGEFVFGRDEYHRGMRIDQYRLPIQLQPGRNTILVKACQNEQKETWTKEWQFQLRISDETGAALLAANRAPTPANALNPRKTGKK